MPLELVSVADATWVPETPARAVFAAAVVTVNDSPDTRLPSATVEVTSVEPS